MWISGPYSPQHEADRVEVVVAGLGVDADGHDERVDVAGRQPGDPSRAPPDDVLRAVDALLGVRGHGMSPGAGEHEREPSLEAEVERLRPLQSTRS